MKIITVLDMLLLVTILLCACDALRQIRPRRQPWLALGLAMLALGALGWLDALLRGAGTPWFALVVHAGLAVYAASRLPDRAASLAERRRLPHRRNAWP